MYPLVTIALLAYNQESFIAEAVDSMLAQTYQPLQIIISDDYSQDETYSIASKLVNSYNGPHQIELNKNERNLGIGRHVNRIMELAAGEIICVAAGDDISLPERVEETVAIWRETGRNYLSVCSQTLVINEIGKQVGTLPQVKPVTFDTVLRTSGWIYGASHAWHRSLFDVFGPLHDEVVSEDKAIGFRSLLLGSKIGYIEKPLVQYRFHSSSVTFGSSMIRSLGQKRATFQSYVDDFAKARDMGYLNGRDDIDDVYRRFTRKLADFELREKVFSSSLPRVIALLITSGNNLTLEQKKNLFLNRIKVHKQGNR